MPDADELIPALLAADGPVPWTFRTGPGTTLRPARFTPAPDGEQWSLCLDGPWRFRKWPFGDHERILAAPTTDDRAWPVVEQPGKVFYQDPETRPADVPRRDRGKLTHIDPRDGALLRRAVRIPAEWAGRRVRLRFDAIYPGGRVFLNGRRLGTHLSGLTPIEWDVTDDITPGEEAVIAVRLLRRHAEVDLDMPRHSLEFCGLAQSGRLLALPAVYIADYHLPAALDEDCRTGRLAGTVTVANTLDAPAACRAAVVLLDPAGVEVARAEPQATVPPTGRSELPVAISVASPALWSDESPTLYTVRLELEGPGDAGQAHSFRTGFRRLDLRPDGARLNGRFIKLRGVNHLTFHPDGGLYTPAEWLRRCLTRMKQANVNAIRTRYLAPPALAELCDEMGFYLFQELPLDRASERLAGRRDLGSILHRVEAGIRRDRHHVCILAWSIGCGNLPPADGDAEVFWGNMKIIERLAKALSPHTATVFPPPGPTGPLEGAFETRVGDLGDTRYSFRHVRRLLRTGRTVQPTDRQGNYVERTREQLLADGWSGVWVSTEWGLFNYLPDLHNAPYLSLLADRPAEPLSGENTLQVFLDRIEADWALLRDEPTCLGGFFFPWMAAGTGRPWGWTVWSEDADCGVVTSGLLPKPAFWALRAAYSPIRLPERVAWRPGEGEITLRVRSLYHRIDLADCTFRTMLGGGPPEMGVLGDWRDIPAACLPGGEADVTVPLWNDASREALAAGQPVVCRCIILDPTGYRPVTHAVLIVPEQPPAGG